MFTLARLSMPAAPVSAAFAALAVLAPVTSAAAPSAGAADALHSAPTAQPVIPTMPVERNPHYLPPGKPTPGGDPVALGTDAATVAPGSTAGTTVVPPAAPGIVGTPATARASAPVRITCRRGAGSRRIRCLARAEGRIVTRCAYRARRITSLHVTLCRASAKRRLATSVKSAAISWQGFPRQTAPAVGALYYGASQMCTATVVSPTLVLTAAHCIWANGGYIDFRQVRFAPGQSWGDPNVRSSVVHPHGLWAPSNMWVTGGYTRGDFSADFALLEFAPLTDGRRIGDVVGSYSITPNINWQAGTRAYLMGYPTVGYWSTAQALHGRGQYACDSSYGRYMRDGAGWSIATDCAMNQGASGGPWFVLVGNSWTIAGVNSRCTAFPNSPPKVCIPWAREMISSYVDNSFVSFWNTVQPQLNHR
jgi:hypothetical protein